MFGESRSRLANAIRILPAAFIFKIRELVLFFNEDETIAIPNHHPDLSKLRAWRR
jgi:hypothetical protein